MQFLYFEWSAAENRMRDSGCCTCLAGICMRWLLTIMSMMPDPRMGMAVVPSPSMTCSGVVAFV